MFRDPQQACGAFHLEPAKLAALEKTLLGETSVVALAETFKVLGDPTRVRILDVLTRSELCVCDIATLVGLSESAVSHQLRLLRGMRLVRPRRVGRMVFYTLDDQHIVRLFEQGLIHVEERVHAADLMRRPGERMRRSKPERSSGPRPSERAGSSRARP
jgi:DNA-binding transcriptional ArsR family regulator